MKKLARLYPDFFICTLLVLLTAAVYLQVGSHEFITYDDTVYLTENPIVRGGLTLEGLRWAFTTTEASNWHPLTWLSHMLDCQFFGPNAGAHHLVNLLFHLANTVLLFLVLRWMTGAVWRSAFVAALFALHPLHVESVAWIAERKDVLSTFFFFMILAAYIHYTKRQRWQRYLLVLFGFSLGLLAKPMLVTLPFVLLLLDYWPLGRTPYWKKDEAIPKAALKINEAAGKRHKEKGEKDAIGKGSTFPWFLVYEKIPFFVLTALSCVITIHAQQTAIVSFQYLPFFERLSNAIVSYIRYILKMVWPLDLSPFYPYAPGPAWVVAGAAILITCVTLLAVRKIRPFPYVAVGWFWYLGTLFPVIGIVQVGEQALADRYTYVPLIGLFIILAWGIYDLAEKIPIRRIALAVPAGILITALMVTTWLQVQRWRDSVTLFNHALAVTENNYVARNVIAVKLLREGKLEEALHQSEEALRMNTSAPNALMIHGIILFEMGKPEAARKYFLKIIESNPDYASGYYGLGSVYYLEGDMDRAIEAFLRAISLDGNHFMAHMKAAEAFSQKIHYDEAMKYYKMALKLQPRTAEIYSSMGSILVLQGRVDEAIAPLNKALQMKPDYAKAHNNLGSALLLQKKRDEAIVHFQEAVRLDPDYRLARENLSEALAQKKKPER
ncbi:MAG: tetratricopeptide repeat protein [Deltaproteobacteria bacterium]|nr:tetratricopeptide repeat protein [Deltaproteobacteria bacterium]